MRDTVLVTGSRDFAAVDVLEEALLRAFYVAGRGRIVHGGARGADSLADAWGRRHGLDVQAYPVDHRLDGPWPAAGLKRNARMVKHERERIAIVLAFTSRPDQILTSGTAHCVGCAIRWGLPVWTEARFFLRGDNKLLDNARGAL